MLTLVQYLLSIPSRIRALELSSSLPIPFLSSLMAVAEMAVNRREVDKDVRANFVLNANLRDGDDHTLGRAEASVSRIKGDWGRLDVTKLAANVRVDYATTTGLPSSNCLAFEMVFLSLQHLLAYVTLQELASRFRSLRSESILI